jgi:inner membrane transporter RhtA
MAIRTESPTVATPSTRSAAPLLVLGSVVSVQVGAAVAKGLFPAVGAAGAVLLRLTVAATVLAVVTRPRLSRISRSALLPAVAFGGVIGVMNLTFYLSLTRLPLGPAVTFEFMGPLLLAVVRSRRPSDIAWAAVAGLGVVAVAWTRGGAAESLDPVGVLLALGAGALWAGYIVLSKRVGRSLPGLTGLSIALVVAAVLIAPVGLVTAGSALVSPQTLAMGLAVGLLSAAVPWALEMHALRRLPARRFSVMQSLQPVAAAVVGFVVLGEALSHDQVAGIAMVCLASAATALSTRQD